ncbi:unnamed protein product [Ectocarpus sp. 6 AP-2014]
MEFFMWVLFFMSEPGCLSFYPVTLPVICIRSVLKRMFAAIYVVPTVVLFVVIGLLVIASVLHVYIVRTCLKGRAEVFREERKFRGNRKYGARFLLRCCWCDMAVFHLFLFQCVVVFFLGRGEASR